MILPVNWMDAESICMLVFCLRVVDSRKYDNALKVVQM